MSISALLALGDNGEKAPNLATAGLAERGWSEGETLPCPDAKAGSFYEVASEDSSTEIFALGGGRFLAARLPLPDHAICREISKPTFIEEI